MAIDRTQPPGSGIPLDGLTGTRLIEAVDAEGRLTDDPTRAVAGTLVLSYSDGSDIWVDFDRTHAIPPPAVASRCTVRA